MAKHFDKTIPRIKTVWREYGHLAFFHIWEEVVDSIVQGDNQ
jgi:hypothetical protein